MARSRIDTYKINKKTNEYLSSRKQQVIEKYGGSTNAALEKEFRKKIFSKAVLDSGFANKFMEVRNVTDIISSNVSANVEPKYQSIYNENPTKTRTAMQTIGTVFDVFSDGKQTARQFQSKYVELANINHSHHQARAGMSPKSMIDAYENLKGIDSFVFMDTETVGGRNQYGIRDLDFLQEYSFRKFKKVGQDAVEMNEARVESMIGITQEQYNYYYENLITNFNTKGYGNVEKHNVAAGRFAKIGHKDTRLNSNVFDSAGNYMPGIVRTESFAGDDAADLMNPENIKRGLDRMLEIGNKQRSERMPNGLMTWEHDLLMSTKMAQDNFMIGYNSTTFDNPVMSQQLREVWGRMNADQKEEYRAALGLTRNKVPSFNPSEGNYLDVFDVLRTAGTENGKFQAIGPEAARNAYFKNKGSYQQENIGHNIVTGMAPHTAGADVTTGANIVTNGTMDRWMNSVKEIEERSSGTLKKNSVIVATGNMQGASSLSFTTDPHTGDIRFSNGLVMDTSGNIKDQREYGAHRGAKKDVTYKIDKIGERQMSEKWQKNIQDVDPNLAVGKLYSFTLTPYMDEETIGDNKIPLQSHTFVFPTKEAMEGALSSDSFKIGNVTSGGNFRPVKGEELDLIKENYSINTIMDGKVTRVADGSIEDIKRRAAEKIVTESGSRIPREQDYGKIKKMLDLRDMFIENGINSVEEQKRQLALYTAQKVSTGSVLEIDHSITQILGNSYKGQFNNPYASTVNNMINSWEKIMSQGPLIDKIVETMDGYGDLNSEQKQYVFKTIMDSVLDELGQEETPLEIFGKDTNYFEFKLPKGFARQPNAKSMPKDLPETIRVDLNGNGEYKFINDLLNITGREDRVTDKTRKGHRNAYSKIDMVRFAEAVNGQKETKGIFDEFLYGENFANARENINDLIAQKKGAYSDAFKDFSELFREQLDANKDLMESNPALKAARDAYLNNLQGMKDIDNLIESTRLEANKYYKHEELGLKLFLDTNPVVRKRTEAETKEWLDNWNSERINIRDQWYKEAEGKGIEAREIENWDTKFKKLRRLKIDDPTYKYSQQELKDMEYYKSRYDKFEDKDRKAYEGFKSKLTRHYEEKNVFFHGDTITDYNLLEERNKTRDYVREDITAKQNETRKTIEELIEKRKAMQGDINKFYESMMDEKSSISKNVSQDIKQQLKDKKKLVAESQREMIQSQIDEVKLTMPELIEDYNTELTPDVMASQLIEAMKKRRELNPQSGYVTDRTVSNLIGADKRVEELVASGKLDKFVGGAIDRAKKNVANLNVINDKVNVETTANEIVDAIFMPKINHNGKTITSIDDIVSFAQDVYGYNKENAKLLELNLRTQRKAHVAGISGMIQGITENRGLVLFDREKQSLGFSFDGDVWNLDNILAKTTFNHGILANTANKSSLAANMRISFKGSTSGNQVDSSKVGIESTLMDAYDNLKYLGLSVKRAASEGRDKGAVARSMISRYNTDLYGGSVLGFGSIKDSYASQYFGIEEVFKNLHNFIPEIEAYGGWHDEGFAELVRKQAPKIAETGYISSEMKEAVNKNLNNVLRIMSGIGAGNNVANDSDIGLIIRSLGNAGKETKLADNWAFLGSYAPIALNVGDSWAKPTTAATQATSHRVSDLTSKIEKLGDRGKNITVGTRIKAADDRIVRHMDGVGNVSAGVTLLNANVAEKDFKNITMARLDALMQTAKTEEDIEFYSTIKDNLRSLNLTEQGAVIDGRVATMLANNNQIQRINNYKDFARDSELVTNIMQRRLDQAMPDIDISGGKVKFSYGLESIVKEGEPLIATNMYGGNTKITGSKMSKGFFGMRYFAKNTNTMLTEEDIQKFLDENMTYNKGEDITDVIDRARNLLDKNFTESLYVKDAYEAGYNKISKNFSEKAMGAAIQLGAGQADKKVYNALKAMGLSEDRGKILSDQYIDMLGKEFEKLSVGERQELGFNSVGEFVKALRKEKYAVSDFIFSGEFEGVSAISVSNTLKHENIGTYAKQQLTNLMDFNIENRGMTKQEAAQDALDSIKKYRLFNGVDFGLDETGENLYIKNINNLSSINAKGFAELIGDTEGLADYRSIKDGDGNTKGYITSDFMAYLEEYSTKSRRKDTQQAYNEKRIITEEIKALRESGADKSLIDIKMDELANIRHRIDVLDENNSQKKLKLSLREQMSLGLRTYNQESMDEIRQKYGEEKFNELFGDMVDGDGKLLKKGVKINQALLSDIDRRAIENMSIENNQILGPDGKLMNISGKEYVDKFRTAAEFNHDILNQETLLNRGFEEMNLADAILPYGENNKDLLRDKDSITGRNLILNTGLTGDGQIKQVAIPSSRIMLGGDDSDTIINNEVYKSLSAAQRAKEALEEAKLGQGQILINQQKDTPSHKIKDIKDMEADYNESLKRLQKSVDLETKKTIGEYDNVYFDNYAYQKASTALLHADAFDKVSGKALTTLEDVKGALDKEYKYDLTKGNRMYNISEFQGETIGALAQKGVYVNASWQGREYFDKYLAGENFKEYGFSTVEEAEDYLEKYGTIGLEARTPSIMADSSALTVQFLDRSIADNKTVSTPWLMLSRNQDHDGDSILQAELDFNGLTYFQYNRNKQLGVANPEGADEYFNSTVKSIAAQSATTNVHWAKAADEIYTESDLQMAADSSFDNALRAKHKKTSMRWLDERAVVMHSQLQQESADLNVALEQFSELKNLTSERIGADVFEGIKNNDAKLRQALYETLDANPDMVSKYSGALDLVTQWRKDSAVGMSRIAGKASIGDINIPLHKMKLAASEAGEDTYQFMFHASNVLEQNIVSSKHGLNLSISKVRDLKAAYGEISSGDAKGSGIEAIFRLMEESKDKIIDMSFNNMMGLSQKYDRESEEGREAVWEMSKQSVRDMAAIFKNDRSTRTRIDAYLASRTTDGGNIGSVLEATSNMADFGIFSKSYRALSDGVSENVNISMDNGDRSNQGVRSLINGAQRLAGEMPKGTPASLAIGAVGIAAAIMTAGYIGGNPGRGTTAQAQQRSNEENKIQSLQDPELGAPMTASQGGQGYVININATTNKGRAHASQAIQKAMQSSTPTDINISMNIADKTRNISSRFMDKLMTGAI